MTHFTEVTPTLDNYWRSIILFGRNVASYKFALGKVILRLGKENPNNTKVLLEDLALPFAREICEHLKLADKQGTSSKSQFLDICRRYNEGLVTTEQLQEATIRLGFVNVIDAFHNVNNAEIPIRFFTDHRSIDESIIITDNIGKLLELPQSKNLPDETEARWRLVETAWDLGISRNLISVSFDPESKNLIAENKSRRVSVTSCKSALNGYQKGKCFFCFDQISVLSGLDISAEVDHFFPHTLKSYGIAEPINGVWNLVLSCTSCNRGVAGKFASVPTLKLLERLYKRNEYLISSHHPLRETLISQTGNDEKARRAKIQNIYKQAMELLVIPWEPEPKDEELF